MREKWGEFLTERYMPRYNVQVQKTRILVGAIPCGCPFGSLVWQQYIIYINEHI